ncbi:MAG: SsrA-binding protein [Gammaproteobacteria bacterium]|nr:MAG: SsrA-binding protein [Gammaproteobacteria bacterium]PIE36566.1 MAG: SsrA-binding protein [Gammaproteobacteria bacterium]
MAKKNKKKPAGTGGSLIVRNKRATFDYRIDEKYEAGLALQGWEVKSLRAGKVQLTDGHVQIHRGEAWLLNCNITPLNTASSHYVIENRRRRKLLLHRREIARLTGAVERKGYSIVAMSMFWKRGKVKLEIGLGKGKKEYDKRAAIRNRDWQRDKARVVRTH